MINVLPQAKNTRRTRKKNTPSQGECSPLQQLEHVYSFRNEKSIATFLQQHPHIIALLLDAYPYIEKHFGAQSQVFLEACIDPELAQEQLLTSIVTTRSVDEALTLLDHFDDDWFLPHLDHIENLITIQLEAA